VQLVLDLVDEIRGAVHAQADIAAKANTQHVIEAREMIHVRVRHEHIADAQKLAGRQG
jgi:hypothetical protein